MAHGDRKLSGIARRAYRHEQSEAPRRLVEVGGEEQRHALVQRQGALAEVRDDAHDFTKHVVSTETLPERTAAREERVRKRGRNYGGSDCLRRWGSRRRGRRHDVAPLEGATGEKGNAQ